MKIYYPKSHYDRSRRGSLFPLLRPFVKGEKFKDSKRITIYGISEKDFVVTDELADAEIVILTMAWNYYVKTNQTQKAIDFVNQCQAIGKKVLAINVGDFGVHIPYFENLIILRTSGYKSRFSENENSFPPFIADPLQKYFTKDDIVVRLHQPKPVIGFCGQANSSRWNAVQESLITFIRNMKYRLGLSPQEPQELRSTSFLRASVLKNLEKSPKVKTNFIYRKDYRAGVKSDKSTHKTTLEFYGNLMDSDYIVCLRGAGNFSIRFYETLAMGRIPIFINTDCGLPLEKNIAWKDHVVWVEYDEREQVAQKVSDFHKALSEKSFIALQIANRKLWEEHLTMGGFFKEFLRQQVLKI